MVLSLRQLISALLVVPSGPAIISLQRLEPVSSEALESLISTQSSALLVQNSAGTWSNLGMALALQANSAPVESRAALQEDAAVALRSSLLLAPANPYVWTRLAIVRQAAGADDLELLRYLRLAWRTGPNEERLRIPRISMALRHWRAVTTADRQRVFADILGAWELQPQDVMAIADTPFAANVIRAGLMSDLPSLDAFERAWSTRRGRS